MSESTHREPSAIKDCDFCLEQEHGAADQYALRYQQQLPSRTVYWSRHFRVFPSIGQIAQGHVLITPLFHYTAIAEMPLELISELESIRTVVRSALTQSFGQCVFFEHGTRTKECGGCGIYHAHMHAVPVNGDAVLEALEKRFKLQRIRHLSQLANELPSESSYLFFEDVNANKFVTVADYLPSQYMRKLLAESIGNTNWDWRDAGWEPALLSTFQTLTAYFRSVSEHSGPLP